MTVTAPSFAPGATLSGDGVEFAVYSRDAARVQLCLFDSAGDKELARLAMGRDETGFHRVFVEGAAAGTRYGFRADGVYSPDHGLWFDPAKLLVDPYAKELDRRFVHDGRLALFGAETADIAPKAIVTRDNPVEVKPPLFRPGGFVYEVAVRAFTMLHPDVPEKMRGTVGALAHPALLAHLKRLGVDAVELMPITAWIDERHLPPLGLFNSWGYNPIALMALDPRLVPGGWRELADTVAALRAEGIGTILDLVFNHSGESDRHGATLSMRGLDNLTYYRHVPGQPGELINDTGCGNTIAGEHPVVRQLVLDSLRHFVRHAGVDGFRFDLATILGREADGFSARAALLSEICADPLLKDRVLIAEPWDIGPGGYQLGNFPKPFLEWNDRFRDDARMFWRGDSHRLGSFVTAFAGSADIFSRNGGTETRTVNFLAAHDGFTLADLVSHTVKHNGANGEDNRDGHNENHSWNNGAEGATTDGAVLVARRADIKALLASLFLSRGTIMLTAGDEGGRSQQGNNNAYCQDNAITWMHWDRLDDGLIEHTAMLSAIRKRFPALGETAFLSGAGDVEWLTLAGTPMTVADWEAPFAGTLLALLVTPDLQQKRSVRLAIALNRTHGEQALALPAPETREWVSLLTANHPATGLLRARSVEIFVESH
ncbi:glycogen debranching protein GlgX [Shinella zoogloeoides]|uniref:Glycogen debranching protein GlgX n=1 Tax=Shinella zoogloeoides TaxID=352475 RepID=A0A6N8TB54_SHIZO|nr:glycogen debranching protein GlgX [Shinella zoogloeoides]MXN99820.1 glycogen debranching protein GlgX [Shinella zoogloeoides]UEX80693.1 glycogen debranching protein GlgX [Shinella zoogloeoides]